MKYLTKTENNEENVFTKPSGYTSARSPRYIIYTSFAHDFTQRFLYSFAHDFPTQHFLYSFAPDFPVQFFFHQKIPAAIATGILIVQILY